MAEINTQELLNAAWNFGVRGGVDMRPISRASRVCVKRWRRSDTAILGRYSCRGSWKMGKMIDTFDVQSGRGRLMYRSVLV